MAELSYRVKTWKKGGELVGEPVKQPVKLAAGEVRLVTQTVPVPDAILWSPNNPFLYMIDVDTGGDNCSIRFGMREFHCDSSTGQAILNGKPIYLRGSSITVHRFFGDAQCGGLPWNDAWVRKFLVDIPRRMHWNAFRICIGPPPERWLDIADEAGLLLQYEFPIWSDREPFRHRLWTAEELLAEFREFISDNWNHPSIVIWDASNETVDEALAKKVIPAVRRTRPFAPTLGEQLQSSARCQRSRRGPSLSFLPLYLRPRQRDREATVVPDDPTGTDDGRQAARRAAISSAYSDQQ